MPVTNSCRTAITDILGALKVFGGIVLLAAISWEVITGDHLHFSENYLHIQLAVCILFLTDFFIRWGAAPEHGPFFLRHFFFFVISVPYLNIISWSGAHLSHDWALFIGLMPMARAFLAFYIVVKWLVTRKASRLMATYVLTVIVFTYLAALVFYDYEAQVNPKLDGFGNALWWAWMNVTTVGAEIFAVTPIGKVITVMLPTLGMMMFPIFTTYIMQKFPQKSTNKDQK